MTLRGIAADAADLDLVAFVRTHTRHLPGYAPHDRSRDRLAGLLGSHEGGQVFELSVAQPCGWSAVQGMHVILKPMKNLDDRGQRRIVNNQDCSVTFGKVTLA